MSVNVYRSPPIPLQRLQMNKTVVSKLPSNGGVSSLPRQEVGVPRDVRGQCLQPAHMSVCLAVELICCAAGCSAADAVAAAVSATSGT